MAVEARPTESRSDKGTLRRAASGGPLVAQTTRSWLLPGADELFRGIYTRAGTGTSEVLGVTSAIVGEGKSTIALGLAVAIAQDFPDRRVLLVETDLEAPKLAADFGIDPNPGLIDCLLTDSPVASVYRPTELENLHLVPSGGPFTNSGRILRSAQMADAVEAMRETADIVILDLAGILSNSDGLPLTDLADGVIFVVRAGVTPTTLVNKALRQIEDSKVRGIVLNGTRSSVPGWLRRLCGS